MKRSCPMVAALIIGVLTAGAEDWPQWRGPTLNGASTETGLPETFSATENVLWKTRMIGRSAATPIVWKNRVFTTACDKPSRRLFALCLDATNGKVLWKHTAGKSYKAGNGNVASSCSPVTDGKHVWFSFGNGRLMACTFDGTVVWDRDLTTEHGPISISFGYSSSPLLFKGNLYVPVLHGFGHATRKTKPKPDSYVLCVDGATGKDLWKHVRKTHAPEESIDAYTTPHPLVTDHGTRILVNGGDHVTAHDPATGNELWRSDDYNTKRNRWFRTITSVTTHGDLIICPVSRGTAMFALRPGGTGQLTRKHRIWTFKDDAPDVCVPLSYNAFLFVLDGAGGVMTCRDPQTGKALGRRDLESPTPFYASPTGADGKIYCINNKGNIVVLSADKNLKVLHRTTMNDTSYGASIAVANGCLFIRTDNRLFCIQKGAR